MVCWVTLLSLGSSHCQACLGIVHHPEGSWGWMIWDVVEAQPCSWAGLSLVLSGSRVPPAGMRCFSVCSAYQLPRVGGLASLLCGRKLLPECGQD